jgi:integrase
MPKKRAARDNLYKRSDKPGAYYWVRFRVRNVEVRRSTGTADRAAAEDFEKKLRDDAWRQSKLGIVRRTWNEAAERWLKERAMKRSIGRDREAFAVVAPYLNGASLDELTKASLAKLRQALELPDGDGKTRKPATVLRLLAPVKSVLRECVKWDWLTDAPHMTMPEVAAGDPRHITRAEFEKLFKQLVDAPHVQAMARFSIETGQRYSAVAKLQWSAVDIKRKHAYISSATSKSKRPINMPLSDTALAVLKAQRGKHAVYVFTDHKGRAPVGSVKTAWLKAVKRASLEGFRWHDMRHSWASWHTQDGTPPIVLQELGGWASLDMVERYSHLAPSHLAQWVGRKRGQKRAQAGAGK